MILSQVDAGGDGAVVGIRLGFFGFNSIACLKKSFSTSVVGDGQLQWKTDSMLMKYISCGPQLGCWGVNMNRIYFTEVRRSLKGHRKSRKTSSWNHINTFLLLNPEFLTHNL